MNAPESPVGALSGHVVTLGPGQTLTAAQSPVQPSLLILQQAPAEPSWIKAHAGQLAVGAAGGVLVIALLLTIAVVVIAVAVGAVACSVGWLVIKSLAGGESKR
ncbi:hypothetical protein AB0A98_40100 [Streptomyces chrestomyceticus]|uniref:hypothetical protein n=1 Tax=Streptomyces chrestomyceticus TaxID=68185 RepID=UPI0033F0A789